MEEYWDNQSPRWVLDTNVLLDWLIFSDRAALPLVEAIESGAIDLVSNELCRRELARVLAEADLPADVSRRARALVRFDEHVTLYAGDPGAEVLPQCRDSTDKKFLELARDTRAHALVTKDRELLRLARRVRELGLFKIIDVAAAIRQLPDSL